MRIRYGIFFLYYVTWCTCGMPSNGIDTATRKSSCATCEELDKPITSGTISRHPSFVHEKISESSDASSMVPDPEEKLFIPTPCPLCHELIDTYETAISSAEICKTCATSLDYFHINCALKRLILPYKTALSQFFGEHDLYHEIKLDDVIKRLRARGALVDWPTVYTLSMAEHDCAIDHRIKRRLRAKVQELSKGFTESLSATH